MQENSFFHDDDVSYSADWTGCPTGHTSRGRAALGDSRAATPPFAARPRVRRSHQNPGRRGGTSSCLRASFAPLCPGLGRSCKTNVPSGVWSCGRKTRGFFILEMIVGLGLLGVAAFALALATSRAHLASSTMADSRQATRAAEATLSCLEAGLTPAVSAADTKIRIRPLGPKTDNGQWVDVTATVRAQTRTLTGCIPRSATQTAPDGGGAP